MFPMVNVLKPLFQVVQNEVCTGPNLKYASLDLMGMLQLCSDDVT